MIIDNVTSGNCLPFFIGDGSSLFGSRIGGAQPEGVFSVHAQKAYYLLTIPLEEDGSAEVSIFLHPDWDDIMSDHSRILYSQEDLWVELIVHGPSLRSTENRCQLLLTPHPLLFGTVEPDRQGDDLNIYDEPGAPLRQHKVGGSPYYVRHQAKLVDAIVEVKERGYRQLLQLTFPGPRDADIDGDWPFADGNFYLFFKYSEGQYHWCYGWLF